MKPSLLSDDLELPARRLKTREIQLFDGEPSASTREEDPQQQQTYPKTEDLPSSCGTLKRDELCRMMKASCGRLWNLQALQAGRMQCLHCKLPSGCLGLIVLPEDEISPMRCLVWHEQHSQTVRCTWAMVSLVNVAMVAVIVSIWLPEPGK